MTWKSLCHPNLLPLLGVIMNGHQFTMVSEQMENGKINEYIKAHPDKNQFELVGVWFLCWACSSLTAARFKSSKMLLGDCYTYMVR